MSNIAAKIASIRSAIFGKDVRESIASGIETMNIEVESTTGRELLIEQDQASLQQQFNIEIATQVTPEKTTFISTAVGKNIYNSAKRTAGYTLNADGTTSVDVASAVSDFIPVTVGKTVYSSNVGVAATVIRFVVYDVNKIKISTSANWAMSYLIPANAKFIRFAGGLTNLDGAHTFQLEYDAVTSYVPYSITNTLDVTMIGKGALSSQISDVILKPLFIPPSESFGINLYNSDSRNIGYKMDSLGVLVLDPTYSTSPYIPVIPGKTIYFSNSGEALGPYYTKGYDINKTFMSSSGNWLTSYLIPAGVSFIRYTSGYGSMQESNQSQCQYDGVTSYEPYVKFVEGITKPVYDLVLPKKLPCVIGHKLNLYYEAILSKAYINEVEVRASLGSGGYYNRDNSIYAPLAGAVSTVMSIVVKEKGVQTIKRTSTLVPVAESAGTGLTWDVLIMGDSKTDQAYKATELINLFSADPMDINLIGTRGIAPYKTEGRSAWGIQHYYNQASFGGFTNPFLNPGTGFFDLAYYMTQQALSNIDVFFIDLGANDHFSGWSVLKPMYEYIIANIHAYDPTIRICLSLQEGSCQGTQTDAATAQTKNLMELENMFIIKDYDNREAELIFVVPQYVNVDPYNDYNIEMSAISNRNTTLVSKCTDKVHPAATSGMLKIADSYYYQIKYIASLG